MGGIGPILLEMERESEKGLVWKLCWGGLYFLLIVLIAGFVWMIWQYEPDRVPTRNFPERAQQEAWRSDEEAEHRTPRGEPSVPPFLLPRVTVKF